jgi:hypothetical protein
MSHTPCFDLHLPTALDHTYVARARERKPKTTTAKHKDDAKTDESHATKITIVVEKAEEEPHESTVHAFVADDIPIVAFSESQKAVVKDMMAQLPPMIPPSSPAAQAATQLPAQPPPTPATAAATVPSTPAHAASVKYTSYKVTHLRDLCKQHNLLNTGNKSTLIERLLAAHVYDA